MKENPNDTAVEIPFSQNPFTYLPYGETLFLVYKPVEQVGLIHLPKGAKQPLPFVVCKVLKAGPDVKMAKEGTRVLISVSAIMTFQHDGVVGYVTAEKTILAVVE